MLENAKGKWVEELPNVLWAYRTTPKRSTSKTPFSMIYRIEAVILAKIGLPSMRTMGFSLDENDRLMTEQLDFLEENREILSIHLANYQRIRLESTREMLGQKSSLLGTLSCEEYRGV